MQTPPTCSPLIQSAWSSVFWLDLATGRTMDMVGTGDLPLAEAVDSREVACPLAPKERFLLGG